MTPQLRDAMQKAFTESAVFTFGRMLVVDLGVPLAADPQQSGYDISAVIGFSGDIVGNCALRMSLETARQAVSRLGGEQVEDGAEIADGVGELVNMIAGNAKAALSPACVSLSFPEVVRGKGHIIGFYRHSDMFELFFASEIGTVAVVVAYSEASNTITS